MRGRTHPTNGMLTSIRDSRWLRGLLGALVQVLAFPLGAATLLAASLIAATTFDSPFILISVGVTACLLVILLLSYPALTLLGRAKPWRWSFLIAAAATCMIFALFRAQFLQPLIPVDEQFAVDVPDGVELWELRTGSIVAVRQVAAMGTRSEQPIVFLHGGPGGYSVALRPTVEVISRLTADGYDVYFYDQVGGGLSARLPDISEYSLDRHLRDLEALYERIGSKKIIIIGSSWGAALGANYMATNPDHVAAAVFSGSAPIFLPAWNDIGDGGLDEKLSPTQRIAFSAMVETPRLFAALVLADINHKAAVQFAGEAELGSLFDQVANEFYLPMAVCNSKDITTKSSGYGFWSNRMTGKTLRANSDDPRPKLKTNNTPVLVLRGECDYKKEAVAKEFATVFPNSQFNHYESAGHMLYWEQPDEYLRRVREFLTEVSD